MIAASPDRQTYSKEYPVAVQAFAEVAKRKTDPHHH
jgi:hypothetical protein